MGLFFTNNFLVASELRDQVKERRKHWLNMLEAFETSSEGSFNKDHKLKKKLTTNLVSKEKIEERRRYVFYTPSEGSLCDSDSDYELRKRLTRQPEGLRNEVEKTVINKLVIAKKEKRLLSSYPKVCSSISYAKVCSSDFKKKIEKSVESSQLQSNVVKREDCSFSESDIREFMNL